MSSSDEEMYDDDEMEEEVEEDDDDDVEEMEEDSNIPLDTGNEGSGRQQSFQVIPSAQILSESKLLIDEAADVLGLPTKTVATILLRHCAWNREKLVERYMENSKKLCEEAGLSSFDLEKPVDDPNKKHECLICMDIVPASKSFALACGHRYCNACWKQYLEIKVKDGVECIGTRCPAPKCKTIAHEEVFRRFCEKAVFDAYSRFLLRSYVDDNPKVKWCPAPGCGNCIRCERKNRKEAVRCTCGFAFCFKCNQYEVGDHMPAECDMVEKWQQKASDESENVKWMLANTKKCPVCRSPIEKNGGCMHMTCRKNAGGCGHEFCWLCRGPWTEHGSHTGGYYNCNKYDKSTAKSEDDKAQDAKTELEQYMFYFHRFEAHKNALKIADDQRRGADKKGTELMERFDVRAADTKFLSEATEELLAARRVLEWSYVFGFYLDKSKGAEKNLYEYLQEELEKHTNHLSELYETAVDKIVDYQAFIKWKEDVTNYTRVTKKFLDNFVEGVSGGLTSQS